MNSIVEPSKGLLEKPISRSVFVQILPVVNTTTPRDKRPTTPRDPKMVGAKIRATD